MTVLIWIILGAIAGGVTTRFLGAMHDQFANIIVGIIGAVTGGLVLKLFGDSQYGALAAGNLLMGILGAAILIAVVRKAHRPAV